MRAAIVLVLVVALGSACGGNDADDAAGDQRSRQLRDLAADAGLGDEIADFFALAGKGATSTYQLTFASSTPGQTLTVSQDLPNRRLDVAQGSTLVSSKLSIDGVGYRCDLDDEKRLVCDQSDAALEEIGAFGDSTIDAALAQFTQAVDDFTFTVSSRKVAGTAATCLVTTPRRSAPRDAVKGTLCLSDRGAVLLVDAGDEHLEAKGYTTTLPAGTFSLPKEG